VFQEFNSEQSSDSVVWRHWNWREFKLAYQYYKSIQGMKVVRHKYMYNCTVVYPSRNLSGKGNNNGIALLQGQLHSTRWNGVHLIIIQLNCVLKTNFQKGMALSLSYWRTMPCPCWQVICLLAAIESTII
jgi:hypothetical protein